MKITINEQEIELRQTFRTMMLYENIAREAYVQDGSITSMLLYFYCNALACTSDMTLDFDDFMKYIDDNPTVVNEFANWLSQQNKINNLMKPINIKEKKRKSTKQN